MNVFPQQTFVDSSAKFLPVNVGQFVCWRLLLRIFRPSRAGRCHQGSPGRVLPNFSFSRLLEILDRWFDIHLFKRGCGCWSWSFARGRSPRGWSRSCLLVHSESLRLGDCTHTGPSLSGHPHLDKKSKNQPLSNFEVSLTSWSFLSLHSRSWVSAPSPVL